MGLISRVSSRTYRKLAMAETFKKNVIIDAQDHLAGRLCATVAKELLRGNNVTIVRCEGSFISYDQEDGQRYAPKQNRTRYPSPQPTYVLRRLPTTIRCPEEVYDHRCFERSPIPSRPKSRQSWSTLPRSWLAIPRCRRTT